MSGCAFMGGVAVGVKEADRDGVIAKAMACFGPLSLLVNSAAIFRSDRLPDFSDATFFDHMKSERIRISDLYCGAIYIKIKTYL